MMQCRLMVAVCTVTLVQALAAQERTDAGGRIEIYHRTGTVITSRNGEKTELTDVNSFRWRSGSKVSVVIADQNPLLFTYDATVKVSQTDQAKVVDSFASTAAKLLTTFGSGKGGGLPPGTLIEGLSFTALQQNIGFVGDRLTDLGSLLARSIGTPEQQADMKREVAAWKIQKVDKELREQLTALATIRLKCLRPDGRLSLSNGGTIPCSYGIDGSAPVLASGAPDNGQSAQQSGANSSGQVDPKTGKPVNDGGAKPNSKAPAKQSTTAGGTDPKTSEPPKPTVTASPGGDPAKPNAGQQAPVQQGAAMAPAAVLSIAEFVALAGYADADVKNGLATLVAFAADAASLNTPLKLSDRQYDINRQEITVKVAGSSKYDTYIDAATRKSRDADLRSFSIVLEPYSPANLALSPAAVFVFPGDRHYTAQPAGSAFTIHQTKDDVASADVAAMLMITPNAWSEPTVGASFQLGITPVKDRVGLYAGLGLNLWNKVSVGGGYAYRQVDRLTPDLAENQTISTADQLKTERRFVHGFYLHITAK